MARDSSIIPVQICLVNDESSGRNPKLFRRASTLSNKSDFERAERRRSSLMSLFSKAEKVDAELSPDFEDEKHLELFKSVEFQAYLKEHNILTTVGLQVIFQQFLRDRDIVEERKSTDEKGGAAAPVYRRKNSGDSLLRIAVAGRVTAPGRKRRSTTNDSENKNSHVGSINSLDESIWSLDDSLRRDYMSVIRGDTESLFQQPKEANEVEQQVDDDEEEESMLKTFFRRSSDVMSASIDRSYHDRRDSIFSSFASKGNLSSLQSELQSPPSKHLAGSRQWKDSCKVEQQGKGVRSTATDDSSGSARLEDLLKTLDDTQIGDDDASNNGEVELFFPSRRRPMSFDDLQPRRSSQNSSHLQKSLNAIDVEDDASNNGEVEVFFPSRRRSMSFDDAPPRRSSLISRPSESSSQLQKCLNEIDVEDDASNNGEVELFFPSRRRSLSYEAPPRRPSLDSRASESSSQLQKCLNEINADNIRSNHLHTLLGDDDQSIVSGNSDSVGTISSFASDQALLCKATNNVEDVIDTTVHTCPGRVDLHYHRQKLSSSDKSCSNHAICGRQPQDHFQDSTDSLLVEWGEAKYDSDHDN